MHSIWLMPTPARAARLREIMARLSVDHDLPEFEPHVTVLGSLDLPLAQVLDAAKTVAQTVAQTGEVSSEVWAVTGREDFFTALTLDLRGSGVFDLHLQACAALGLAQVPHFEPHLSVAYGMPGGGDKIAEIKTLSAEFLLQPLVFDRLEVVLSSKTVPIPEWRCLESFTLKS